MKRRRMLAIGLGAYLLALIAMAPATLADAGMQHASNGRLRLTEPSGTLWFGAGQVEIRDADGQTGFASPLSWRFRPGDLFRGRLAYEVVSGSGTRPFSVAVFWSRIELANADVSVPAAALGLGLIKLASLELTGNVNLRIPKLVIRSSTLQGSATLEWRAAGSALAPVSPLGDYMLRLETAGPEIRAILETIKGPLQLRGHGSWTHGHVPAFVATAHIPPNFRQQLAPFLRLIAVERSDESFELQFK